MHEAHLVGVELHMEVGTNCDSSILDLPQL